jgi:Zn-dependent protease with chaperone function
MKATSSKLRNKEMNEATYALRRRVMDKIYLLKGNINLPRLTIRVTDSDPEILGMARMGKGIIWVTEATINMSDEMLLHVVAHEVGHAVFSLPHNESCPLMGTYLKKPASLEQIVKILKRE